jgi:hypothetical protein
VKMMSSKASKVAECQNKFEEYLEAKDHFCTNMNDTKFFDNNPKWLEVIKAAEHSVIIQKATLFSFAFVALLRNANAAKAEAGVVNRKELAKLVVTVKGTFKDSLP